MINSTAEFLTGLWVYNQYLPFVGFGLILIIFLGYKKNFIKFREASLDRLWRKEYKTLFVTLALITSPFILVFGGGINELLLFYTLVALLWYARETMDLKNISNKEIVELRKSEMNKFLPIIVPDINSDILKNGRTYIAITNIGKGIAKDVQLKLDSKEFGNTFSIEPDQPKSFNLVTDEDEIKEMVSRKKKTISMSVSYSDIYDRDIITDQITFKLLPDGDYVPVSGKWRFQVNETR